MMVIATDVPLDGRQLSRLAMRAAFALGRTGTVSSDGSGDFAIAFSTTSRWQHYPEDVIETAARFNENDRAINQLFLAVVELVEEAIWNAVIAAETMTGRDGNTLFALPHEDITKWMAYHGMIE